MMVLRRYKYDKSFGNRKALVIREGSLFGDFIFSPILKFKMLRVKSGKVLGKNSIPKILAYYKVIKMWHAMVKNFKVVLTKYFQDLIFVNVCSIYGKICFPKLLTQ